MEFQDLRLTGFMSCVWFMRWTQYCQQGKIAHAANSLYDSLHEFFRGRVGGPDQEKVRREPAPVQQGNRDRPQHGEQTMRRALASRFNNDPEGNLRDSTDRCCELGGGISPGCLSDFSQGFDSGPNFR